MRLGLDNFATNMVKKHKAIQKDKELMRQLKEIGTEQNCLEFFNYIYKGYGRKRQNQYKLKEILDEENKKVKILIPRIGQTIKQEEIEFLVVYSKEIQRLEEAREIEQMVTLQN